MKVNICDCCGKKINIEESYFAAFYQKIEAKTYFPSQNPNNIIQDDIIRTDMDICKNCSEKIDRLIEALRKTNEFE